MAVLLTDREIQDLITEPKHLPVNFKSLYRLTARSGHSGKDLDLTGVNGNDFRLILRQSQINSMDFSVILAYLVPNSNIVFRLKRYNGRSHQHKNQIEGNIMYGFHIHIATERYQDKGMREDSYAEATNRYADLQSAIQCLVNDCAIQLPQSGQLPLL